MLVRRIAVLGNAHQDRIVKPRIHYFFLPRSFLMCCPMRFILALVCSLAVCHAVPADEPTKPDPLQQDILRHLDELRPDLIAVNRDIWTFAELGLQEHRSAARLAGMLKKAG